MVELRQRDNETLFQSFAGDVYNSAVYLKRCFADIESYFVSAVGQDKLSDKLLRHCQQELINTDFTFRHPDKVPGMYYIETDEHGERSFTYWRNDSAAKKLVDFLDPTVLTQMQSGDMLLISGISLAIIDDNKCGQFWQCIAQLKRAGVKIVFDPNYRARLWESPEQAIEQFELAFEAADIALPGVEDFDMLMGLNTLEAVLDYLAPFNINEIVVKNGPQSVITQIDGERVSHSIIPVSKVVDTTSAGDAFNGVYLGARLSEQSSQDAVTLAATAAATVIQQPGAIAPKEVFVEAMKNALA